METVLLLLYTWWNWGSDIVGVGEVRYGSWFRCFENLTVSIETYSFQVFWRIKEGAFHSYYVKTSSMVQEWIAVGLFLSSAWTCAAKSCVGGIMSGPGRALVLLLPASQRSPSGSMVSSSSSASVSRNIWESGLVQLIYELSPGA